MTTSSDKAKSKLLDSMRMSKEGSTETTETAAPAAESKAAAPAKKPAPAKKKAAKKPAAKKAAAKKPTSKKASGGSYSTRESRSALIADTFESGRRIWPD